MLISLLIELIVVRDYSFSSVNVYHQIRKRIRWAMVRAFRHSITSVDNSKMFFAFSPTVYVMSLIQRTCYFHSWWLLSSRFEVVDEYRSPLRKRNDANCTTSLAYIGREYFYGGRKISFRLNHFSFSSAFVRNNDVLDIIHYQSDDRIVHHSE